MIGYQFYEKNELTGDVQILGSPRVQPDERNYHTQLNRLVTQLSQQLKEMKFPACRHHPDRPEPDQPMVVTAVEDGAAIFLAEATSDLMEVREEVRTYLTQSGSRVLPLKYYSRAVLAFQQAMDGDLEESALFVQMLGPHPPIRTDELPDGYEGLQLQRARARKKTILRWRSPDLDLSTVKDESHRQFLADAMAMDLENFKNYIVETKRKMLARPNMQIEEDASLVLLRAGQSDCEVAEKISKQLFEFDIDSCIFDDEEEDASLSDLAEDDDYDGLMVVYGDSSPTWVRDRVMECRRVEQTKKHRAPICAVYIGPPGSKSLKCRYKRLHVIDHADQTKLRSYAEAVTARKLVR